MTPVKRHEILDYVTYGERRDEIRARILKAKAPRRVHVGPHLTFLFENHDTILYQIQEMVFAERLVKEADIRHELDTYNSLLGEDGGLGCTLLIEIEEPEERARLLQEWLALPRCLFAVMADGTEVPAFFDAGQVGEERLSSVQFLKFAVGGEVPVALRVSHPALAHEAHLSPVTRDALARDLGVDHP